jgi:serine phosphatase RsbU (regulator of sigma subunit)
MEFYGMERFKNLIAETSSLNSESALKRITQSDEEWRGINREAEDDITLIVIDLK